MNRLSALLLLLFLPASVFASDVEVGFSPDGGALELVLNTINSAHTSLHMAAYTFTSKPIAEALVRAGKRGVEVRVVVDRENAKDYYSQAGYLVSHGIPVRIDFQYGIMHNKFIVVDGASVEEGSFNYTGAAANRNAENALVLHDAAIAGKYEREWKRLWSESQEMKPRF